MCIGILSSKGNCIKREPRCWFSFKHDYEDQNEGKFGENIRLIAYLDKEKFVMTCTRNATYLLKTSRQELLL